MAHYLHRLSALLFYALGLSFFAAYILWRNAIGEDGAMAWLTSMDMPLLLCGLLYGGLSVYLSIESDTPSKTAAWIIGVPLACLFLLSLFFNFA